MDRGQPQFLHGSKGFSLQAFGIHHDGTCISPKGYRFDAKQKHLLGRLRTRCVCCNDENPIWPLCGLHL